MHKFNQFKICSIGMRKNTQYGTYIITNKCHHVYYGDYEVNIFKLIISKNIEKDDKRYIDYIYYTTINSNYIHENIFIQKSNIVELYNLEEEFEKIKIEKDEDECVFKRKEFEKLIQKYMILKATSK